MNTNQGQSSIILLGEAGSAAGEKASLCAGQRGLTCQIHSWEEVQQFGTAALQDQRVLPLLLDAWLTPKTLQQVMKWAAGNSFCIMPVGDKDAWEKVVPLENSEWVGMEVYPPEGEWTEILAGKPEDEKEEDSFTEDGTLVYRAAVKLEEPLVDLNEVIVAPAVPKHTSARPLPKKVTRKRSHRRMMQVMFLLVLLFLLFIGTVSSFYLYLQEEHKRKLNDGRVGNREALTEQPVADAG